NLHAGDLTRLQARNGPRLVNPSFVLLRIENHGTARINAANYQSAVRVKFPGRKIVGLAVSGYSHTEIEGALNPPGKESVGSSKESQNKWEPLSHQSDDELELPKVRLKRSQHYKILVVLDGENGQQPYAPPVISDGAIGPSSKPLKFIA